MEIPENVDSSTRKVQFGCGNVYITINVLEKNPVRSFLKLGKTGQCVRVLLEAIGRLVTLMFEYSIPIERIQQTLSGLRCDQGIPAIARLSCIDAFGHDLKRFLIEEETENEV